MRGRKPKPTALKILQGNPGHRPIGDVMSTDMPATPGIPTPPEHLDEIARKQWFRLCDELHSKKMLALVDRDLLATYCDTWSLYLRAQAAVNKSGLFIKSPNGYPVQNPAISIANKARTQLHKLGSEFGLSPAARARIRVPNGQQELPLVPDTPDRHTAAGHAIAGSW